MKVEDLVQACANSTKYRIGSIDIESDNDEYFTYLYEEIDSEKLLELFKGKCVNNMYPFSRSKLNISITD